MRRTTIIIAATVSAVILPHITTMPDVAVHQKPVKVSNLHPILLSGWATTSTWRKLVKGMSKDNVRELMGEPSRISKRPPFEVWTYPPESGIIRFDDSGRVYGWDEP